MNLLSLPRQAVEGYIKLARLPLDTALKLAGRGERGELTVDRAEAAARDVAGAALGDEELRRDAQLRRAASDERERAHDLRDAAEHRERAADQRYAERKQAAEARRRQASQRAVSKRRTADDRDEADRSTAHRTARARKAATERASASKQDAIDSCAKRERLSALDRAAETLERRDAALTAQDEAQRLADAAARAKTTRKR
jgi:colicin import membrane protein